MRRFEKIFPLFFLLLIGQLAFLQAENGRVPPVEALKRLMEGNQRFASDQLLHPQRNMDRREATVSKQEPFAVILGCSDSRVPPEIIFDQGIGDLFIVRVAGNVLGPIELDSIEYSTLYLHSSVILVLGHQNCGAVRGVMAGMTKDIEAVARKIEPAIKKIQGKPGDPLTNAIKANVENVVEQLKKSDVIAHLIKDNKVKVVGGYYDLDTGVVKLIQ